MYMHDSTTDFFKRLQKIPYMAKYLRWKIFVVRIEYKTFTVKVS